METEGSTTCEDSVAKTADGGSHFSVLGVADSWSCSNNPPAQFLAFDDHGDGFLYGPQLFVTHDGGTTWTPDPQTGAVVAVAALGYSIWMVEGTCPANATYSAMCPLQVLTSTDGGGSWQQTPSEPGATASVGALSLAPAQGQTWLVRLSVSAAYVLSTPTSSPSGAPNVTPLWHTTDGGRTWTSGQIQCGLLALSTMMTVAPDGALVAICASGPSTGFQPKSMAVSTTGGATWAVQSQCADRASAQCNASALSFGYLGSIAATSADTAFVTGDRTPLLVTYDGGLSWHSESVTNGNGQPAQVVFFDAEQGVVLGRDSSNTVAIWHTVDGGSTWSELVPSGLSAA